MSLDSLNRTFSNAFVEAERLVGTRKAAPSGVSLLGMSGGVNLGTMAEAGERQAAREQYKHYSGRVFAAINVIAKRISGQPVCVAQIGKPKNKQRSLEHFIKKGVLRKLDVEPRLRRYTFDEVELVPDHALLDVLDDPNELMLASTLWLISVANLLVTGRCLWLVNPDPARPEILPIPTTWAIPVHDKANGRLYAKWLIKPPTSTDQPLPVDGEYVANFYIPDPEDPYSCISMLAMQGDAILSDEAISKVQRVSFNNELNPSVALVVGDAVTGDGKRQMRLEPHHRKQLITWMQQQYAGAMKYGLPMILDAVIRDIKQLRNKPAELGFMDSSQMTEKQIFSGFGVPLSSAGLSESASYASSAVVDHTLVTNAVNPIAKLFSEGMTAWVLPLFERSKRRKMRAWIIPAEAYDPDLQIRRFLAGRQSFAITRNENRTELLGLPPIDGWDDVVVPAGMRSVSRGEPVEPVMGNSAPKPTAGQPAPDAADNENMRQDRNDQEKAFDKAAFVGLWVKAQVTAEQSLESTMLKLLQEQRAIIVNALHGMAGMFEKAPRASGLADTLFNQSHWDKELRDRLTPVLRRDLLQGAAMNVGMADKALKVLIELTPEIRRGIDDALEKLLGADYWPEVNRTTRQRLVDLLDEGFENNDSLREMAQRIEDGMGDEWAGKRATLIARTESGGALNAGQHVVQLELEADGLAFGKEWLSVMDADVRPDHAALNGTIVGAGEDFDVGGSKAPYPGWHGLPPEQRCNCILPGNVVQGAFDAGVESFYCGEAVEIVLASGRRLTVTPNHPILSENGFVAAGAVNEGNYVLSYGKNPRWRHRFSSMDARSHDKNYKPAFVEQVFQSLCLVGSFEISNRAEVDLHGDERSVYSDVKIVRSNRKLLGYSDAACRESRSEPHFRSPYPRRIKEFSGGPLSFDNMAVSAASPCIPGILELPDNKFAGRLDSGPLQGLGFGSTSCGDAGLFENGIDRLSRSADDCRQFFDGNPGQILLDYQLGIYSFGSFDGVCRNYGLSAVPQFDAVGSQMTEDCKVGNAKLLCERLDRDSALVFLDKVININRFWYSGHVYDLQSRYGVMVAGGIVISNCRCTALPVFDPIVKSIHNRLRSHLNGHAKSNGHRKCR